MTKYRLRLVLTLEGWYAVKQRNRTKTILVQSELCISFLKTISKNWQFVPIKASISTSLNFITQCKYWMWFLLNIYNRIHYSYGCPRDFDFNYVTGHEISILFIWGSMRFHFYLYWGQRDFSFIHRGPWEFILFIWESTRFNFIHMGIHEISFLFIFRTKRFQFYS